MRKMQLSASGGGAWATGCALAKRATCGLAGKSIRLTRQTGAGKAGNSFATGAGVIGFSAVPSEITQQAVAAQQPSEKDAWWESGCAQHRAMGAAMGA
jgi:hypothetical protein